MRNGGNGGREGGRGRVGRKGESAHGSDNLLVNGRKLGLKGREKRERKKNRTVF